MNVYVIYKFENRSVVEAKLEEIKNNVRGICFFRFTPDVKIRFWHKKAKEKIKESNLVVFFDSVTDDKKESVKNIKWELKTAEKYRKRIVVFKDSSSEYSQKVYDTDYSDCAINQIRYKVMDIDRATEYFTDETTWNIQDNLLHDNTDKSNEYNELLLEQYKIMVDTSEKLMERRHSSSKLYTTICSALLALIGASAGFKNLFISGIITLVSGIIITALCINWYLSLGYYDLNNRGKFEVINQIEKSLPAEMFECEYRYNTLNGIKSYSLREKKLPLIFISFGIALIVISAVLIGFGIKNFF